MSTILNVSTIALCLAGVVFSLVFIWLNAFSKITDLSARNTSILRISKVSMELSLVFALLTCLLSNSGYVGDAIARAAKLYSFIAVSWLIVILGCGFAMLVTLVSKTEYRESLLQSIKKIFSTALTGAIAGMILAWLLS